MARFREKDDYMTGLFYYHTQLNLKFSNRIIFIFPATFTLFLTLCRLEEVIYVATLNVITKGSDT